MHARGFDYASFSNDKSLKPYEKAMSAKAPMSCRISLGASQSDICPTLGSYELGLKVSRKGKKVEKEQPNVYSKASKDGFRIAGRMEAVGLMEKKRKTNKDDGTWARDHGRLKKSVHSWELTPNTAMVEVDEEAKQNSAPIPSFAMGVKEDAK